MADDVKTGIRVVVEGTETFANDLGTVAEALGNAGEAASGAEEKINETSSATENLATQSPANTAKFSADMETKMATAAAAALAVVTVILEVQGAIIDLANATAEQGDAIAKGAQKLGFTTDAYQEWDYVLKKNGSSMEKASGAISKLTQNISAGGKKPTEAIESLGLSLEELQGMDPEEQFSTIVSALQQVEDLGTKNDLASALFGAGGAKNLGTLLTSTGSDVTALTQQAHDLNLVMSGESIQAAKDYQDSIDDFNNTIQGIKNTIGQEFMPVVQTFRDTITQFLSGVDWQGFASALSSALGPAVQFLNEFILPIASVSLSGVVAALQLLLQVLGGLGEFALGPFEKLAEINTVGTLGDGHTLDEYAQNVQNAEAALAAADKELKNAMQYGPEGTELLQQNLADARNALINAKKEYDQIKAELEGKDGVQPLKETRGTSPAEVTAAGDKAVTEAQQTTERLMETYDNAAGEITSAFVAGADETGQAATESIEKMNDTLGQNMAILNGNAVIWGMDMMRNLANGIADGTNTYVLPAIDELVQIIKDRIGFSEPKVGPLSDFHTYAPDMMALFAKGIRDNRGLIEAAIGSSFDIGPMIASRTAAPTTNVGGVSVQIYGAPGQSVDELYEVFSYRLSREISDREAVYST